MPTLNKRKLCNKHTFYDAIENPRGCPICNKDNNKDYSKNIRAKDRQKIYNSKEWKRVREKALIRDMLMCKSCEKNNVLTEASEVHHIQYLEHRIDLAYDLDNLISVCAKCHQMIHANDKKH